MISHFIQTASWPKAMLAALMLVSLIACLLWGGSALWHHWRAERRRARSWAKVSSSWPTFQRGIDPRTQTLRTPRGYVP